MKPAKNAASSSFASKGQHVGDILVWPHHDEAAVLPVDPKTSSRSSGA